MKPGILAVISFALIINAAALPAGTPAPPVIEKIDVPGIVNFSQIDGSVGFAGPRVGFGGATDPGAMAELKARGFTAVVNLRLADEEGVDIDSSRAAAHAAGLDYIHLPFDPESSGPEGVAGVLNALGDRANQPVYIHCGSATRVGSLWMIGRVLRDGWGIDEAGTEAVTIAKKPDQAVAFATAFIDAQGK